MKVVAGIKQAEEGDPTKYRRKKCRGVVCGNFEAVSEGEVTYTPNLDIGSLRCVLAICAARGWPMGAMDASTAFLNANRAASRDLCALRLGSRWRALAIEESLRRAQGKSQSMGGEA